MKCFVAILLLALFAVVFAEAKPAESDKIEQVENVEAEDAARDKRGVLLSYTSPLTYPSYRPVHYSYSALPYYRSYPYYYNSPYYQG